MVYFDFTMAVYAAVIKWVVFPEPLRPIHLYLVFEKSSRKNQV